MNRSGERTLPSSPARIAAVLALALVAILAAIPGSASARPLFTGVTNPGSSEPLAFQRIKSAGAAYVRIPLSWQHTAPETLPGSWNPTDPADSHYTWTDDDDVVNAIAAGLTPVLQIDEAPTWAQRCKAPGEVPYAICDPDPAALGAFATAVAKRYSGKFGNLPRVQYYQGLNEPNLSLFFFPQYDTSGKGLSPGLYRTLINSFYDGIKAVDPSNLVLAAGLGPIAVPQWTMGPMRFARELLCMKGHNNPKPLKGSCEGGVRFDILAVQPYTTGGPTHVGGINDVQLGGIGKMKTLIKAADKAGRIKGSFDRTPIWVTEFSWDTQPPDPGGLAMPIASRWTAEALYNSWRVGITHFFWFSLHDDAPSGKPPHETLESGLYFRGATLEQDHPKEVMQAFRFPFVAYPRKAGLFVWGRTPTSGPGKVRIEVWTGSRWRKAAVAKAGKTGIFNAVAKTRYGKGGQGMARAVYGGEGSIPFAMKPVKDFRHAPFGDQVG